MNLRIPMSISWLMMILCVLSCKKDNVDTIIQQPETVTPPTVVTPTTPSTKIYYVGTGSGNLTIDGSIISFSSNSIIKIKGGSYNNITISNIVHDDSTVYIQNDGLVEIVGDKQMILTNLKNVTISGDGNTSIAKGFVFRDKVSDVPSIQLKGNINNFTLQNVSFSNLQTYNVIQYASAKVYNGSEDSYSNNLKFLNLTCDNVGTLIRFNGSAENGSIIGLVKNVEIAFITFKNSRNVGSAFVMENADSYNVHNNLVQNVNQDNSNHNGIFYFQGNGKFYNNIVRDHQGNAIRAWVYSIGTSPQDVLIFNNIVVNSREYSAFELQAFSKNIIAGKTTYVNAKVFNNTCGNLLPKYGTFPAQILDLYGLEGGSCTAFNNFGYKFTVVGQNNTNYIWNELSTTKAVGLSNKYFSTFSDGGIIDDTKFNLSSSSPAKNAGSSFSSQNINSSLNSIINLDIYGNQRNINTPSIGAVE